MMRVWMWLLMAGCAQTAEWDMTVSTARFDTGALDLVPTDGDECPDDDNKLLPGYCGCDWLDLDIDGANGPETCVHSSAAVDGGATLGLGSTIGPNAVVGAATLGDGATVASRAVVMDGANIGEGSFVGRGARVGLNSDIGSDSEIGRSAVIGDNVAAAVGQLTLGYSASIGSNSQVLGTPVVLGNLVHIGESAVLRGDIVIGRSGDIGDRVDIGVGTTIGPGAIFGDDVTIEGGVRIRKDVEIGALSDVLSGAQVGRGATLETRSEVGVDARLGANVRVLTDASVGQDEVIPRGTTVEPTDNCAPQSGFDKVWDGSTSDNWSVADNWTPSGVPSSNDSVFLCGLEAVQPRLTTNVSVESLSMSAFATLDTNARRIVVLGDLVASTISGTGVVEMNRESSIEGTVPRLDITSRVTLSDTLTATGFVTINTAGTLLITDQTFTADQGFTQTMSQPNRGIRMSGDDARLYANNGVQFRGTTAMGVGSFAGGEAHFRRNFFVEDNGLRGFYASNTHVFFDGDTVQGLSLPGEGALNASFNDLTIANTDGSASVSGNDSNVTVRGDLVVTENGRFSTYLADVNISGDLIVGAGAAINDQNTTLRVAGAVDIDPTAHINTGTFATETTIVRPQPTWSINQIWLEGPVTLDAPWDHSVGQFRIQPGGSLTLAGHAFTLDGTYLQDIGTDPTGGLRMTAGDVAIFEQGINFHSDVDMAATNFTGGVLRSRWHISTEAVDFRTVYMPGTELIMEAASTQIIYTGNGLARFGTVTVAAGVSTATNSTNGAGSVIDNLNMYGNMTPNKDLTITDTLTVFAGGGIGGTGGAITNVLGACVIDPAGNTGNGVVCP